MGKELLFRVTIKDCRVDTFRAGGNGGQNQNKRDTGVRVSHLPSGAVGVARDERKQLQNKRLAFRRMAESAEFQTWARRVAMGWRPLEEVVDEQLAEANLDVEYL